MDLVATLAWLERTGPGVPVRTTPRLVLRPWSDDDAAPFAAINTDPDVVAHLPGPLTRAQSDATIAELRAHVARRGFGIWAIEGRDTGAFLGFVGLNVPTWSAPFLPAVEIAWRLARPAWGRGLMREAAEDVVAFAWDELRLPSLLSWTVPANTRSWGLMIRLGFREVGRFAHPKLPPGHALSEHVIYRLDRP